MKTIDLPTQQEIEELIYDKYNFPISPNIDGLKFKFYSEFIAGAMFAVELMHKKIHNKTN